jgi:hydroxyacylglutathione hydrolase
MDVSIIPILDDNYAYVIQSDDMVGVVDPGEAEPVIAYLEQHNLKLDWIINTHHHGDHVDGNVALIEKYGCKVAAPDECKGDKDVILQDGEDFKFGDISFQIFLASGHTMGHVVLFDPTYRILFSGDTLFVMGCGRLFEGSHADMFKSMQVIKSLPPETVIYGGHEYTPDNAKFATHIMPDNADIKARAIEVMGQECTMPTLQAVEMITNPYLIAQTVEEFTKIRTAKDNF